MLKMNPVGEVAKKFSMFDLHRVCFLRQHIALTVALDSASALYQGTKLLDDPHDRNDNNHLDDPVADPVGTDSP